MLSYRENTVCCMLIFSGSASEGAQQSLQEAYHKVRCTISHVNAGAS